MREELKLTESFDELDQEGREKLVEKYKSNAYSNSFKWRWRKVHWNRIALVNYVTSSIPNCAYLEIGCGGNSLFDSLPLQDKTGVDPNTGGTVSQTSDAFFEQNSKSFDFIWIDGLHIYEQVHRDVENAVACLRPGGWIGLHDLLPVNWKEEHVPRINPSWTGDAWKVAMEIAATQGLEFRIILIDHGVGLFRVEPGAATLVDKSDVLHDKRFGYFYENIDTLPLVDWHDALRWIDRHNDIRGAVHN